MAAEVFRETKETSITISFDIDGSGKAQIDTGIPFFDHMLSSFCVHGFFDLDVKVKGDIEVDFHHTVEDTGLVLGQALAENLEKRAKTARFGEADVPMDDALTRVSIDLSNRPYLVYNFPENLQAKTSFDIYLAKEFFQAFCVKGGLNLHINCEYGTNEHHALESIFKAFGRALHQATRINNNITGSLSTKGSI